MIICVNIDYFILIIHPIYHKNIDFLNHNLECSLCYLPILKSIKKIKTKFRDEVV